MWLNNINIYNTINNINNLSNYGYCCCVVEAVDPVLTGNFRRNVSLKKGLWYLENEIIKAHSDDFYG